MSDSTEEAFRWAKPVIVLSNGDRIIIDDHCYIIVSKEGKLRQWIYKEALTALKDLPIPE